MSFSGINVEHRSQEVEAVKTFLIYSLIGSLALHIGVLSSGIGILLTRVPKKQYEPIDLIIVDPVSTTVEKPEKPPEIIPEKVKIPKPRKIVTTKVTPITAVKIEPKIIQPPPVPQQQLKVVTPPARVETVQPPPVSQPPQPTKVTTEQPQPTIPPRQASIAKLESLLTSTSSTSPIAVPQINEGSENLRETLSGLRNSRITQSSNTAASVTTENTTTSNNVQVQPSPVAVAPTVPTTPQIKTQPENNRENNNPSPNSRGSGNGRAACADCSTKYPEFARRRGIEGRVEVAVDTDSQGNVTNARIVGSSGNSKLDQETLRQARNWKLKPSEGGRSRVSIATDFAIEGSRRYRQVQERKRKQEAQARQRSRQTAISNPSSTSEDTNTPSANTISKPRRIRIRRETTPVATPVKEPRQPVQNRAASSSSPSKKTSTTRNLRESLRNARRQRSTTNSAQEQPSTNRRRRFRSNQPSPASPSNSLSSSQNELRNSLRRSRKTAPPQPAASSEATSEE
ncbi:energy transducer TonB [Umezakia ovalisporum]|uniref:TonB family protein n=2 Tax=Umezakia ovalisporum TaxID=75695 RepID=A0AA43KDJ4_9CYAN|nr:energy transducer TonB [Umezakia ovalisporum]MDH6057022.1 TonB family protein [Umezakia ovalisporum FSS-43]MDH6062385.1 TonB family protein [Umezakia ovalisporum FSS-62]MDH6068472.1 TonB family protein [Umezakia ovalisporum APH033B]MDH6071213.1 TonB family protein [Umezakia ovalisporum CobakiLakeA]MDH6074819.1 TonB family protein [Umezakia ovalisporum CS-1034]